MAEHLHLVVSMAIYGTIISLIIGGTALTTVTLAPMAASAAGTAGLLAVWLAGLGVVASSPELARRCLAAGRGMR